MTMNAKKPPRFEMKRADLEQLGRGHLAYVRSMGADEAKALMGQRFQVPAGSQFFCLYMADGTPVSISDSREAAIANAMVNDLTPMRLN